MDYISSNLVNSVYNKINNLTNKLFNNKNYTLLPFLTSVAKGFLFSMYSASKKIISLDIKPKNLTLVIAA